MPSPNYNISIADDGYEKVFAKGSSGGANNKIEYLGKALPGTPTSSKLWQIQKWTYDANGFLTNIKFAQNSADFNFIWDDRANYF